LDQSFISAVWDAIHDGSTNTVEHQIFTQLMELRERQDIFIVVSDIHSQETSAIPDISKRKGVWELANRLADGTIAVTWSDIFIVQQRRVIDTPEVTQRFHPSDIGLENPFRARIGLQVIPTNAWRLRLWADTTQQTSQVIEHVRDILNAQESALGPEATLADCLMLIRELWRKNLLEGIAAVKAQQTAVGRLLQADENGGDTHTAIAGILSAPTSPFSRTASQVVNGLDETALDRFHDLLLNEPTGGCACVRLMTAFEAEMLWDWYRGHGKTIANTNKMNQKYGRSRLNDFAHVSTFLPYVDVLTTDREMENFCSREVASKEISGFSTKLYSKKSYPDFERWLDNLTSTAGAQ